MKLQPYAYTPTLKEIIDWLEGQPAEVAEGRLAHHEASQNEILAGREIRKLREKCVEIAKQSKKDQERRQATRAENVLKALDPLVVLLREEPGVEHYLKEIVKGHSFYNEISKVFLLVGDQRLERAVDVMQGGARGGAGQGVLSGDVSHKGGDDSKDSTTAAA
jgi:hypothetical protein